MPAMIQSTPTLAPARPIRIDVRRPSDAAEKPYGATRRWIESVLAHAGGMGLLLWRAAVALLAGRVSRRDVVRQMYIIGVESLPLVFVTSILSGIVTSQQGGYQLSSTMPLYVLGTIVTNSIVLELAPILTAIALIGRVGARITTELGAMKVSEQIDAIHALGRDPVAMLAVPRIVASTLMMPVLVAIADGLGTAAGMWAAHATVHVGPNTFLYGARLFWQNWLFVYGEMKAVTFGLVIPVIAVHMGFRTTGGAEGIGRKTTGAVVFMIIAVLLTDALFPPLFLTR
jgi:phospholipid/cholesterol/gamma-HCH transport system permease protein